MNPTIKQEIIDKALAEDPHHAGAEYLAQFRTDVEAFLSREAITACIETGVYERAPLRPHRYYAFCDPSGGVSDSYTLAIAHREGSTAILDAVREKKPKFSPEVVTEEFSDLLKAYRITKVCGDRYGGEFPRELFRRCGINYVVSKESKSDLYQACLPIIMSGAVDLLDHAGMVNQFASLERKVTRGGADKISHRPGAHDDVANAVAGAVFGAVNKRSGRTQANVEVLGIESFNPFAF
jgi:hypothetical protein